MLRTCIEVNTMGFPVPGVYTVFKGKQRKLRSPKDKAEWSHGKSSDLENLGLEWSLEVLTYYELGGGGSNGAFVPGRSINKWKSTEVWKSMIHQKKCKSFFVIDVTSMLYFGQYRRIWTEKSTRPIIEGHYVLRQQFTFWPQDPFTEASKEHLATCVIYLC